MGPVGIEPTTFVLRPVVQGTLTCSLEPLSRFIEFDLARAKTLAFAKGFRLLVGSKITRERLASTMVPCENRQGTRVQTLISGFAKSRAPHTLEPDRPG